jgi:hypothetical protein
LKPGVAKGATAGIAKWPSEGSTMRATIGAIVLLAASVLPAQAAEQAAMVEPQAGSCTGVYEFFATGCPLTWYGITVYGTVDMGVTWQSRGTPFGSQSPPGDEYILSKNSNRSGFRRAPNQLTQSSIGIKGD